MPTVTAGRITQNEVFLVRFVKNLKHESCPDRRFLQKLFRPRVIKTYNERCFYLNSELIFRKDNSRPQFCVLNFE